MKKIINALTVNKPAKIIIGLYILFLLFGFFAINPLAKLMIPKLAESMLASRASVGRVSFNPLTLKATIEHFNLTEKNGSPLVSFDELIVDFEASSLLNWAWKFKEISLTALKANVAISSNGKLNWGDLLAKLDEDKTPPSDTIPRVLINHIALNQGNISYVDSSRATPFKTTLTPLNFQLDGFSTLPEDRGDYLIALKLPDQGGALRWKGNIGVNPLASNGNVSLNNISISSLISAVKSTSLPFNPNSGELNAGFNYDFSLLNDQPEIALNNVALTLNDVSGEIMPSGALSLNQANLAIPHLDFALRIKTQLQFKDLNLKLSDLNIDQLRGKEKASLLSLPELNVNHVSYDLETNTAKVEQVQLLNGKVNATSDKTGILNWQQALTQTTTNAAQSDASEASKAPAQVETPFSLDIASVQLQHLQAQYEDQSFVHPLTLNVADINLGFTLATPQSGMDISHVTSEINGFTAKSTLSAKPIATLDSLKLNEGEINLANKKISVQSIGLSGFKTDLLKTENNMLNWQAALEPNTNTPRKSSATAANHNHQPDWSVALKKLALENSSVHIEDRSLKTPLILDVIKASFEIQNASTNLAHPLPVKAALHIKQGGQFNLLGKLTPAPFQADLNVKLVKLSLIPFAPYINQYALLKLKDGTTDAAGKVSLKQNQNLAMSFTGGFDINKVALVEEGTNEPFMAWERIGTRNLDVSLAPNHIQMTELQIIQPSGKFIIHEDKTLNLARIMRKQAEATATPSTTQSSAVANSSSPEAFPINIETIRVENAELDFADLSLTPQFGTHINSLGGVINGISTNESAVAQVELDGKVDDYGAARVRGSVQPFKATNFTDLKLSFKNLEMNRLTPYSGKFAGRRIDSGKLSVDLEYKIKQRQLTGENKFVMNKLKLGEKVDSAEAANLPLDLAIAILEDSDGVIDLDLPISGSLDDPKFSYGSIVWKAIRNVLGKIVTAPFRALGKLFGANAEKLEAISFDVGSATLAPPELEKLQTVSTALSKRPALTLGITPTYNTTSDTRAIQEFTVRRQVAEEMGIDLTKGQQPGPIDLNNTKAQKAINTLYDKLTKKSLLKKLSAKFEKVEEGHYQNALAMLTTSIHVTENDLQALANARAKSIQESLAGNGVAANSIRIDSPIKNEADGNLINTKLTLDIKK